MSNALLDHVARLVEFEIITGNKCRDDDGKFQACSEGDLKDVRHELKKLYHKKDADMCVEDPKFCEGNLGLTRKTMPQLDANVLAEFVKTLRDSGIRITRESVDTSQLKPSQVDIQMGNALDKALNFLRGKYPRLKDAIIVSREGNILDGHHRWAALRMIAEASKGKQSMNVIRIGMSIKALIRKANGFKGVEQRAFGEAMDIILRFMTMKG